jgi:pimeloyl-ACP methyl ester carboxylesterase
MDIILPREGCTLCATDHGGTGMPLLFLHAVLLGGSSFQHVVDALSGRRRCVSVDLRGHGRSSGREPDAHGLIPVAALQADIEALIDHLGGTVDAVGESLGGTLALAIAAASPGRIRSLTLSGSTAEPELPENAPLYLGLADRIASEGWSGELLAIATSLYLGPDGQRDTGADGPPARLRRILTAHAPRCSAALIRGIVARADQRAALDRIRCPTTLLIGSDDRIIAPARQRALASSLAGSSVIELPACGHLVSMERPTEMAAAIMAGPR